MRTTIPFLIVFLLFFTCNAYPQNKESFNRIYSTQTIYQFGSKYMKGNQQMTYHDLAVEFTTPRSQEMYRKSRKKLLVARLLNVASLGVIIANIFVKTNTTGSIGFAVGTGLLGIGGIYFQTESSKYVQRAIWERNRDVLNGSLQ